MSFFIGWLNMGKISGSQTRQALSSQEGEITSAYHGTGALPQPSNPKIRLHAAKSHVFGPYFHMRHLHALGLDVQSTNHL